MSAIGKETGGNGSVQPKSYSTFGMTRAPNDEIKVAEERKLTSDESDESAEDSQPTPTTEVRNWRQWQIVISLIYANFLTAASISLQAPFFPKEAESKGATPTEYGLVFGVYEIVVIIMSPIYGKLMSKVSPRFFIIYGVLLAGGACCAFGYLDYLPAGKIYISMAFIVRIFEGFGAAALFTAAFVIIAAAFPNNVATYFSLFQTSFGIGLIVGPTIGGALYQAGGFILPFVVVGGFLLVGCIILFFLIPTIEDTHNRQEDPRTLLKYLAHGGVISYSLAMVSSLVLVGFNAATLEPHLRRFDLEPIVLGFIFIIVGGLYAITTPIWGRISDKYGMDPLTMCILGYCLTCASVLLIGPVSFIPFTATLGTVCGSLVLSGLGISAKVVSSFTGALRIAAERGFPDNLSTYGMVSGVAQMSFSFGAFVGPSIGGVLLEHYGYRLATAVIFFLELFFMLILVAYTITRFIRRRSLDTDACERDPLISQSSL